MEKGFINYWHYYLCYWISYKFIFIIKRPFVFFFFCGKIIIGGSNEQKKEKKRFILLKIFIGFIFALGLIYLYGSYVEPKNIRVHEYKISNKKISENFDGFTIVHLSDTIMGGFLSKLT
ncbi:MAG: hypothetical protein V8R01_02775 [Bacilli bacterium]